MRRDEHPTRRRNPGGTVVWVARATGVDGRRRSYGTFGKRGPCRSAVADGSCCAQHAIYHAYEEQPEARLAATGTLAEYAADRWLRLHPRSERSNATHEGRLRGALAVDVGDGPLGVMPFAAVERRHALELVDVMLREQERAVRGVRAVLASLSAMWTDAVNDGWVSSPCPFAVRVRSDDPRVRKEARVPRVWAWEDMRLLCGAGGPHEAMLRLLGDCGLRLGEVLPLQRADVKLGAGACDETRCQVAGPHVHIRRKAWMGREYAGAKGQRGDRVRERVAPIPEPLAVLLRARPTPFRADGLVFPAPDGGVWVEQAWRRAVWEPAAARSGVAATPHDLRHSWVSYQRAAGVDAADIAAAAGHSVDTATRVYTHALGRSFDAMRAVAS